MNECPKCTSTAPHLHPAVQHGGEVGLCTDPFHLQPTPQNTPEYVADVVAARIEMNALPLQSTAGCRAHWSTGGGESN